MINFNLENSFMDAIAKLAKEKKLDLTQAIEMIGNERFNKTFDDIAEIIDCKLETDKDEYLKKHTSDIKEFEQRLYQTWLKPFVRIEMIIVMCRELGSEIYNWYINSDIKDIKLEVISRLHAHSLQIACEILQLSKTGYADGAMARWRSLHECSVIARILSDGDEELAEKYNEHKFIDDYKFSVSYAEHSGNLNFEKLDDKKSMPSKKNMNT